MEALVVAEFKATLFMTDSDELPMDQSFFDLGLTSLRLTEIKQRLESLLGCGINANTLFNRPTLEQLLAYLTGEVLTELFVGPAIVEAAAPAPAAQKAVVDDLLKNLYQA